MSKVKYYIGFSLLALLIIAGSVYVYFTHYSPKKPDEATTVSVWYVNADKLWSGFDEIVKEFNDGNGDKYGVTVKTKSFSSDAELYDAVTDAVENGKKLPEMVVCNADFSAYLLEKNKLADMEAYFDEWETSGFDERMLNAVRSDKGITAVPVASETDVFLLNSGRFSDMDAISSFEKLCAVSKEYYGRNDSSFFAITDYSRFFRTSMAQLGDEFDAINPHETENENSKYIYNLLAETAYYRGMRTSIDAALDVIDGKSACAIVSSADIMQYADRLNKADISFEAYPCLKDGKNVYIENVTGITALKSDTNGEKASVLFMKWFTSEELNTRFVGDSGYISAYGTNAEADDKVYNKLMSAVKEQRDKGVYMSYAASAEYYENSSNFNEVMKSIMNSLS